MSCRCDPCWFSELMFWGLISQVQVLKIGVPDVGFKRFAPWGGARGFEFPLDYGLLHSRLFMVRLCVSLSYCFVVCFLWLTQYIGVIQLVLVFFQSSCSLCSYRFRVFVGGGSRWIQDPLTLPSWPGTAGNSNFDRNFNDFFLGVVLYDRFF